MISLFLIKFLVVVVVVLVSVAFFTLLERKVLGYVHFRLGPNKSFILGLFQPFNDAMKLFTKGFLKVKKIGFFFFFLLPIYFLSLVIFLWSFLYYWGVLFFSCFSMLIIMLLMGMGVYFLLLSGWSSGSKFTLLGGYRSSAQSISYEVVFLFCLLFLMYMWGFLNIFGFQMQGLIMSYFLLGFLLFFSWFSSCLAESNRSPFDFVEGESELVSGFNIEFSSGLFSFIFIGEYGSIIFLCFLSSLFFFNSFFHFSFSIFFCFFYLWVRCCYPRLRYDFLMMMSWKSLLFLVTASYYFLVLFL